MAIYTLKCRIKKKKTQAVNSRYGARLTTQTQGNRKLNE